jgi:ABC-type uncharacterized transport system substrate-binding protein
LVSYGVDLGETFPRAAEYIDRILKGTRPAKTSRSSFAGRAANTIFYRQWRPSS